MLLFLLPALFLLFLLHLQNHLDIFPGDKIILHLLPGLTVLRIGRFLATQHLGILLIELPDGGDFGFAPFVAAIAVKLIECRLCRFVEGDFLSVFLQELLAVPGLLVCRISLLRPGVVDDVLFQSGDFRQALLC